jgi:hypothetical protein
MSQGCERTRLMNIWESFPLENRWRAVGHPMPPRTAYGILKPGEPVKLYETDPKHPEVVVEGQEPLDHFPAIVNAFEHPSLSSSCSAPSQPSGEPEQPASVTATCSAEHEAIYVIPSFSAAPIKTTFNDLLSRPMEYPHCWLYIASEYNAPPGPYADPPPHVNYATSDSAKPLSNFSLPFLVMYRDDKQTSTSTSQQ